MRQRWCHLWENLGTFTHFAPMTAAIGHLLQLPASFIDQATPLSQLSSQNQGDVSGDPQHITDTSPEGNGIRQVQKHISDMAHAAPDTHLMLAGPQRQLQQHLPQLKSCPPV